MSVSQQDVRHIAALARLEIADERIETLVTELNGILAHMDVLQALDLGAGAQSDSPTAPMVTTLRDDVPDSIPLHRGCDTFAPAFRDGFFLVPRVATHE